MFCKWCGKRMEDYSVICPKCGKEQDSLVNGNGFWDLCHIEPTPRRVDIKKEVEDIERGKYKDEFGINNGEYIKEEKKEKIADKVPITKQEKKNTRKYIIIIAIFLIVLFGIGITVLAIVSNYSDISKQNKGINESSESSIEQSTTQTLSNQIDTTKNYTSTQESIILPTESVNNTNSQEHQDELYEDKERESNTDSFEESKKSERDKSWKGNGVIDDNDNNEKYDNDSDENPYYY